MNASSRTSNTPRAWRTHDANAWSGWACIIGIVLGLAVGVFFAHAILFGIALGAVGFVVGAVVDRSRR